MKLETTIQPRKDGTVKVAAEGTAYVFQRDDYGALVCDVQNNAHVAWLLGLGDFHPYDEADFGVAMALAQGEQGDDDGDSAPDDEDFDDEAPDMDAPPIEEPGAMALAPSAPRVAKPRKVAKG